MAPALALAARGTPAAAVGPVYCTGRHPDGHPCPNPTPIAERLPDGRVVVRHDGREHDVTGRSTTCPRCKTPTSFGRRVIQRP